MFRQYALMLLFLGITPGWSLAAWDSNRPDGHAPISVMGDHLHEQGEWMLSYRYMGMLMDGNRAGRDSLSNDQAFALIPGMGPNTTRVLPVDMTMSMHMLGVMYAPSARVTLMAMLPYVRNEMDHRVQMNGNVVNAFETKADGIGDVGLTALVGIHQAAAWRVHLNLGIGLPTGSITEKDALPNGVQQLPYPMQLGSGSHELRPGVTVLGQQPTWSWGLQGSSRFAVDNNSQRYRLGARGELLGWLARPLSEALSVSLSVKQSWWTDIHGNAEDLQVSPMMNPTANTDLQAGRRLDLSIGANFIVPHGQLRGHRLALEYTQPVLQNIDGPRLETDRVITVGWQKAFGH